MIRKMLVLLFLSGSLHAQNYLINLTGQTKAQILAIVSGETVPNKTFFDDKIGQSLVDLVDASEAMGILAGSYTDLSTAMSQANTDTQMVVVHSRLNIAATARDTLKSNAAIFVRNGGRINVTRLFVIEGKFDAGLYQVFEGNLDSIRFGSGSIKAVHPEWFGDNGLNPAVKSVSGPTAPLFLGYKTYEVSEPINLSSIDYQGFMIRGTATRDCIIKPSGSFSGSEVIQIHRTGADPAGQARNIILKDFRMEGDNTVTNAISLQAVQWARIENVDINNFSGLAIKANEIDQVFVEKCVITFNDSGGVMILNQCGDFDFSLSHIFSNGSAPLQGNIIFTSDGVGISKASFLPASNSFSQMRIEQEDAPHNGYPNIVMLGAVNNSFEQVHFSGTGHTAPHIYMDDDPVNNNDSKFNIFSNCRMYGNSGQTMQIDVNNADHNRFDGLNFTGDATPNHFDFAAGATGNYVGSNCMNLDATKIVNAGSGNTIGLRIPRIDGTNAESIVFKWNSTSPTLFSEAIGSGTRRNFIIDSPTTRIKLGDAAGAQELRIDDSGSTEVASIDSDGNAAFPVIYVSTGEGGARIESGTGAPSASPTNGSIRMRTDGGAGRSFYHRKAGSWVPVVLSDSLSTSSAVSNTNTPSGATVYAIPVYNNSGTLLGYFPLYGSQW